MSQGDGELFERASEFLALFRRGAEFTRELVEENAQLRRRIHELETRQQDAAQDPKEWARLREELVDRIQGLESEHRDALDRLHALETENRQFAERCLEIEDENNRLANLYVASFQLHSTLDLEEVLRIVVEIVINLIGAEVFCVYAVDERNGLLTPVAAEGRERASFPSLPLGEGMVGESLERGEVFSREGDVFSREGEVSSREGAEDGADTAPRVSIPLRVGDRAIGAIALHELLTQKEHFSSLDHELFSLLAGHAATAILAAQLHGQRERKLNTMQGLIELLTH